MNITIELVNQENAYLLERAANDVFDERIRPEYLRRYLATEGHALCVALREGCVIGQARAVVHLHLVSPPELYIYNLGVNPDYQRQGIAKRLLKRLFAFGQSQGCDYVWVATYDHNRPAKGLYASLGMKKEEMLYFEAKLRSEIQ